MVDRTYYVYVIFRMDGSPCYIGKGKGRRWLQHEAYARRRHHNRRLARLIRAAAPNKLPKVKIREHLTNQEACEIERAFIAAIGRGHKGPLVNLTDGGEGLGGYKRSRALAIRAGALSGAARKGNKYGPMSDERKSAISRAKAGRPLSPEARANIGRGSAKVPRTPEWRAAISAALKNFCRRNPGVRTETAKAGWTTRRRNGEGAQLSLPLSV